MCLGLIPLVFVLVGLIGVSWALSWSGKSDIRAGNLYVPPSISEVPGALLLKPAVSPQLKVFGLLLFALFWNGIVSVFVFKVIDGFRTGHPEWGLTLFISVFVAVGLGLIGAVIYQFLALFNARPRLTLTPGTPALGDNIDLTWQLTGRTSSVRSLLL